MSLILITPKPLVATLAATSTSSAIILPALIGLEEEAILVTNNGPNIAFVKFGVGTQTAVVTDTPILPYTQLVVRRDLATYAAGICNATQTAALYFAATLVGTIAFQGRGKVVENW
jgi:hypothetical protein